MIQGPSSGAVELREAIFIESLTTQEDVMTARSFSILAAVIFTIIALLQLTRALAGWEITVGTTAVPVWPSWIAGLVAITLAWLGFTARE